MTPRGIFRRKEKAKKAATKQIPEQKTLLEDMCGKDKELYEALSRSILLNPETAAKEGVNSYVDKAEEFEKAGNHVKARIAYQAAGEISLYEGKLSQVQKFFKKAAEVDPKSPFKKMFDFYSKKENAERAMGIAREFYAKAGKLKEKKEA